LRNSQRGKSRKGGLELLELVFDAVLLRIRSVVRSDRAYFGLWELHQPRSAIWRRVRGSCRRTFGTDQRHWAPAPSAAGSPSPVNEWGYRDNAGSAPLARRVLYNR
jgi:hypothetical protein